MRASLAVLVVGLVACGGSGKKADSPTPTTPTEETPKWEGASAPEPPKPASTGSTKVNEGTARSHDVYDKEATEVVLRRSARVVKDNCGAAKDENGKATGPWGKTTIQIALGHNGHSKGTTIAPPYQGKPVGNCIEKAFTNLTFPPWAGADTQVDWEVELVQPK